MKILTTQKQFAIWMGLILIINLTYTLFLLGVSPIIEFIMRFILNHYIFVLGYFWGRRNFNLIKGLAFYLLFLIVGWIFIYIANPIGEVNLIELFKVALPLITIATTAYVVGRKLKDKHTSKSKTITYILLIAVLNALIILPYVSWYGDPLLLLNKLNLIFGLIITLGIYAPFEIAKLYLNDMSYETHESVVKALYQIFSFSSIVYYPILIGIVIFTKRWWIKILPIILHLAFAGYYFIILTHSY